MLQGLNGEETRGAERVRRKDERDVRSPGRPAEHNLVLKAV